MWRKVFTEVESAQFARTKLRFEAAILDAYKGIGLKNMSADLPEMFWSVKVV